MSFLVQQDLSGYSGVQDILQDTDTILWCGAELPADAQLIISNGLFTHHKRLDRIIAAMGRVITLLYKCSDTLLLPTTQFWAFVVNNVAVPHCHLKELLRVNTCHALTECIATCPIFKFQKMTCCLGA